MAESGDVTSLGEGHSLWQLREVSMSREEFHVYSPNISSSGCWYWMVLKKKKDACLLQATLRRVDGHPLPRFPIRMELRCGEEGLPPCSSYSLTPDGRTGEVTCYWSVPGFLHLGWGFSVLFRRLSVSLRTEGEGSSVSRGIQTDVPDSSSRDTEDLAKLQTDLEKLVLGEEDSDVTLQVRGKKFPAHRNILRARSPVFAAMFGHNMAEKQNGDVTIEDCDPETFPDFLHYLYTGSSDKVTEGNVTHLYQMSDKYEVLQLKALCCEFMKSHLNVQTFCDFLTFALKHEEGDLVRAATEFFCSHVEEIVQSAEWQTFQQDNLKFGNELFLKAVQRGKTA